MNDQTKENKHIVDMHNFDNAKLKTRKILNESDERFCIIFIELSTFSKYYTNCELPLKVMQDLLRDWDIKILVMRESKYFNKLELI